MVENCYTRHLNSVSPFRPGLINFKIPTAVLLNTKGTFQAFGFEARQRFFENMNEVRNVGKS